MNSALPGVVPTERESYIAAKMLRAAWLEHIHRVAEYSWAKRTAFTVFPPDGMEVDAAAKELHVQLEVEHADRQETP